MFVCLRNVCVSDVCFICIACAFECAFDVCVMSFRCACDVSRSLFDSVFMCYLICLCSTLFFGSAMVLLYHVLSAMWLIFDVLPLPCFVVSAIVLSAMCLVCDVVARVDLLLICL